MAKFIGAIVQRVLPLENGPKQWQVSFIFELSLSFTGQAIEKLGTYINIV